MKVVKVLYYVTSIIVFLIFSILSFSGNVQWRHGISVNNPNHCQDYDACTLDVMMPDHTCDFRLVQSGSMCGKEDWCYWHETPIEEHALVCVEGTCVAPDKTTCRGYCVVAADCTNMMDSLYLHGVTSTYTTTTRCISHGCVAYLNLPATVLNREPLTYINQSTMENKYAVKCLHASCTTLANATTMCTYYYHCAPVLFI